MNIVSLRVLTEEVYREVSQYIFLQEAVKKYPTASKINEIYLIAFKLRSMLFTWCVSAPTEIKSTPHFA